MWRTLELFQRQRLGKLLRDGMERIWALPRACHLELNWTELNFNVELYTCSESSKENTNFLWSCTFNIFTFSFPCIMVCFLQYGLFAVLDTVVLFNSFGITLFLVLCIISNESLGCSLLLVLAWQLDNLRKKKEKKKDLWWSLCILYLHACQVRVTVGDSGLCCRTCVTYFER